MCTFLARVGIFAAFLIISIYGQDVKDRLGDRLNRRKQELQNGKPNQGIPNRPQQRRFEQSGSTSQLRGRQLLGSAVIDTTSDLLRESGQNNPKKLSNKQDLDRKTREFINSEFPPPLGEAPLCGPFQSCPQNKYRTIDGFCNNRQNPNWGRAGQPFARWIDPIYDDAQNCTDARTGLPNAREVSKAVHEMTTMESNSITHMVMQWGQFLDHDITHTPLTVADNDGNALTCDCDTTDTNCHNIDLVDGDQLKSANGECINFARSKVATECEIGCREQENSITAYIDASNVYGSETDVAQSLRGGDGRLKVQVASAVVPGAPTSCQAQNTAPTCNQYLPTTDPADASSFIAGDVRVTEQPGLTAMHTIWLREHNLMVDFVERVNGGPTGLSPDKKYLEARRYIGAIHQHIAYNEFLPSILGRNNMQNEGMLPSSIGGPRSQYDASCDATITNAFATAAYRFGHTLIRSLLSLIANGDFSSSTSVNLADKFEDPAFLLTSFPKLDEILLGLSSDKAEDVDRFITEAARDRLFADDSTMFGLDLAALNIQRGRDHGLPGWAGYRQKFGLSVPANVNDAAFWKDAATASALASIYSDVAQIDLFVGMLAEKPKSGALVGDLLYAMLVDQFKRLRNCDRYFYEHGGQDGSFRDDELRMIKSETLAKVLCRQLASIQTIQPNVFLQASQPGNERVSCSSLLSTSLMFETLTGNSGPPPPPKDGHHGGRHRRRHHGGGGDGRHH